MEFNIGDRIKVKEYSELSDNQKAKKGDNPRCFTSRKACLCGLMGKIVDKMYSEAYDVFIYRVQFDGFNSPSSASFTADAFYILLPIEEVEYTYDIKVEDNVVVANLYEVRGEEKKWIARGHGHILNDGVNGFAQAASYALKKIYEKLNGGSLESRPDFRLNRNGGDPV